MAVLAVVVAVEGATLAASDGLESAVSDDRRFEMGLWTEGSDDDVGSVVPVIAAQMSPTGGAASDQGTVNSGLSQRLWVLGSS